MNSIYRKLVISFLALNLFAIGAVGIYSYYKEKEALLSRTFDQLISVRQEKKDRIITFFKQRLNDVENISQLPRIKALCTPENQGKKPEHPVLTAYLSAYLHRAGCYSRMILLPEKVKKAFVVSGDGKGGSQFRISKVDAVFLSFKKRADTAKGPIICEIYAGKPHTRPLLLTGKNIYDNTGRKSGTLVLEINPAAVNSIMFANNPNNGLGKTGEVYLVGSDSLMRSNSRFVKNAVFKTKVETPGAIRALHGLTGEAQFRDYRHIPVLSAYCPLSFSGVRWAVLAEIDTREAMIPIYSIRDNIIYLSLLIALFSAAIITFLSKKISDPIKKLKKGTTKIASGDYGNTIRVETRDEIGELTRSFNEMSQKLKTQADRLENEKKLRLRSVLDAQEEERQRISRELHDGLGPLLLTGKMKLEGALEQQSREMASTIKEVTRLFSDTVGEIRTISGNMMPSGLKEFGLAMALENFCRQVRDNYPVKVHCLIDLKKKRYEKTTETYLFRIAQEAINNVLKHARATEIHLNLEEIDNHLFFTLADNGIGFDPSESKAHSGNGLLNIKERVNLLNGYFALTTEPGKGTRIEIEIPV